MQTSCSQCTEQLEVQPVSIGELRHSHYTDLGFCLRVKSQLCSSKRTNKVPRQFQGNSKAMNITRWKSKAPQAQLCSLDFLSKPQHLGGARWLDAECDFCDFCFLRFGIAPEPGFRAGRISQRPGWRGCE